MTTVESAAITSFKHDHVHYVSEHGFIYYSTHCHFGIRLSSTDELSAQLTENIQKKNKNLNPMPTVPGHQKHAKNEV